MISNGSTKKNKLNPWYATENNQCGKQRKHAGLKLKLNGNNDSLRLAILCSNFLKNIINSIIVILRHLDQLVTQAHIHSTSLNMSNLFPEENLS